MTTQVNYSKKKKKKIRNKYLKIEDKVLIINIIFISNIINNLLLLLSTDKLFKPPYITDWFGKKSIIFSSMSCFNKTKNMLMCQSLKSLNPTKIKIILTNRCINKYQ